MCKQTHLGSLCGQKGRTHVGQRKERTITRKAGLAGALALGGAAWQVVKLLHHRQ